MRIQMQVTWSSSVTAPVSRALHQCCLTAVTVMKMMVMAVDGWKKWTRTRTRECSTVQQSSPPCMLLHLCNNNANNIGENLVSNCVKGDMELDVDSPQQQQTLLQSDYDVEVAMEGDGEKKILYKKKFINAIRFTCWRGGDCLGGRDCWKGWRGRILKFVAVLEGLGVLEGAGF